MVKPRAYFNEFDPKAAAWLRELIRQGHIAPGDVDERSIADVRPDDLRGYSQCHFFAGIGVWSYALRRAGWSDDRPVWTGSCPCQPFSDAGKGGGFDDERHLWPHFHWLIAQCRPPVVLGEQVASKDGLGWLDLVSADLEGTDYAFGAVDLCAAGVGAPHIRQRLYWAGERLADAESPGGRERLGSLSGTPEARQGEMARQGDGHAVGADRATGELAHASGPRLAQQLSVGRASREATSGDAREAVERSGAPDDRLVETQPGSPWFDGAAAYDLYLDDMAEPGGRSPAVGGLADADSAGAERRPGDASEAARLPQGEREPEHDANVSQRGGADHGRRDAVRGDGLPGDAARPGPVNGLWRDADWLFCRDGKWRPVEPGTFPLAHGAAERVGRLRGYGNAIVAPAAQAFIEAYLETEAERHLRLTEPSAMTPDILG